MSHPACKPPLHFVLRLRQKGGVFAEHCCIPEIAAKIDDMVLSGIRNYTYVQWERG